MTQDTTGGAGRNPLQAVSDGLAAAVASAAAWTVGVHARRRFGASGIAWGDGGIVVTADHVLERDDEVRVTLPGGGDTSAQVLGRDPGSDLAALRVASSEGLAVAERAPEDSTRVGSLVLAVGRPGDEGVQASLGVVTAIGGAWRSRRGSQVEGYLRTDTTFYPGFSGGPLVDASGRLVGINTSRFRPGPGITIPWAAAERIVSVLVSQGRVKRAYLGIGSQPVQLPGALAERSGGQASGLLVISVEAGSPADRAGLLMGDILVGIDGAAITDAEELQAHLGAERVGAAARVRVLRGGEPRDLEVTLGERG